MDFSKPPWLPFGRFLCWPAHFSNRNCVSYVQNLALYTRRVFRPITATAGQSLRSMNKPLFCAENDMYQKAVGKKGRKLCKQLHNPTSLQLVEWLLGCPKTALFTFLTKDNRNNGVLVCFVKMHRKKKDLHFVIGDKEKEKLKEAKKNKKVLTEGQTFFNKRT